MWKTTLRGPWAKPSKAPSVRRDSPGKALCGIPRLCLAIAHNKPVGTAVLLLITILACC